MKQQRRRPSPPCFISVASLIVITLLCSSFRAGDAAGSVDPEAVIAAPVPELAED
jgi:hypothetical protein